MIRHYEKGDCERLLKQPHQTNEGDRDFMFDHEDTIVIEEDDKVLLIFRPVFEMGGRCTLVSYISQECGYKAVKLFKIMKPIIDNIANDCLRVGPDCCGRFFRCYLFKLHNLIPPYGNNFKPKSRNAFLICSICS
jgi:hypothetical protein